VHKPKPLRANLRVSKELRELITHMLAKKPKNRPTAREIADMLYCEIAVRPPMQRSLQPRVGRCMGLEGRHWPGGCS
jgi:serine/threonine protein kinase